MEHYDNTILNKMYLFIYFIYLCSFKHPNSWSITNQNLFLMEEQ